MAKTKKMMARKAKLYKQPALDVLRTSRRVLLGQIAKVPGDSGNGRNFQISYLPNFGEFTSLFNEYRIRKIVLTYELPTSILSTAYPRISFCFDPNDASAPLSENDVLQFPHSEVFQFNQYKTTFKTTFVPHVALASYQGAFSGYTTGSNDLWLNCDNSTIQYYGSKEWIANYNSTSTPGTNLVLYADFHMEFRRPR
jgi:hypothetical protein